MTSDKNSVTPISLANCIRGENNALGFLRLLLASLVIVDHAFPLGGFGEDPMWTWSLRQDSIGGICVAGFFAVSGYLVTKSALGADIVQFLWRRTLRIFPAFWVALLITAFFVGPILWFLDRGSIQGYFVRGLGGPFSYFTANALLDIGQYKIHDLLATTTPYGRSIKESVFNGSVWTLIYEWHCYLLVGLFAVSGVFRNAPKLTFVITASLYVLLVLQSIDQSYVARIIPWLKDVHTVRYTAIFMIGSLAAVYADHVPMDDRLGFLALVIWLFALLKGGYFVIGYPAMVYLIFWLACRLPYVFCKVGAVNDYSYGMYIYGFLIQQLLAYYDVHQNGLLIYIIAALVLTFPCAYMSWHFVEKRALGLKSIGPGRGINYWRTRWFQYQPINERL